MGVKVQKSALPTLFNFARVRAAHQPHVIGRGIGSNRFYREPPKVRDNVGRGIGIGSIKFYREPPKVRHTSKGACKSQRPLGRQLGSH